MEKTLQELMDDLSIWQKDTFPTQTAISKSYHLQKEVKELTEALELYEASPTIDNIFHVIEELADCQMLVLSCALKIGVNADNIISFTSAKLETNKLRKWGDPDKNGAYQHVEDSILDKNYNVITNDSYNYKTLPYFIFTRDYSIDGKGLCLRGDIYDTYHYNYGKLVELINSEVLIVKRG